METIVGSAAIGRRFTRAVLTIGNFDGIHRGHRAILDTVVGRARDLQGEAVVYTFDPHPRRVLRTHRAPRLLTTLEQKLELLEQAGVDVTIIEPFSLEFSKTPADVFVRELVHERIRPVEVYVGYDFHFGRDREGSMRMLTEMGPRLGFAVTIIPEVVVEGRDVNSSRIRELLQEGHVEEAALMLGRPYTVRGTVARGDARGRALGFPTANLEPDNEVLPAGGVYAGRVRLLDEAGGNPGGSLPAVTNVGTRPTFDDTGRVVAEAHLIDFEGDLYGRRVEVSFMHHLRPERRFPDVETLKRQIEADVAAARRCLEVG